MTLRLSQSQLAALILAGIAGATARWAAGVVWQPRLALLAVNIAGCALAGWALRQDRLGVWFAVGLCGGLTSFAGVVVELAADIDQGEIAVAAAWLGATVVGCAIAFGVALRLAGAAGPGPAETGTASPGPTETAPTA